MKQILLLKIQKNIINIIFFVRDISVFIQEIITQLRADIIDYCVTNTKKSNCSKKSVQIKKK